MKFFHQNLKIKEKGVGPIRIEIKKPGFGYVRSLCVCVGLLWVFSSASAAQIIPAPPQLSAEGYMLIDASTGKIIVEHNSTNIGKELNNHIYSDKSTKLYLDAYNHAIDGARYNIEYHLREPNRGKYNIR
jgi:hypothetical protein